ncbi:NAD(P)/FAD-dependent oxidoreductase [Streptomyces montanisoli]|uniref:NAD(P)/FAD-dependent oxidoreductase n=1 Tax=Streptomyces montanisoli TaxID=2798581 RepID=A0A940MHR4_9ACTN|nr:FAD-dependent oxidoreductase [Streptomyces montanisoli]MBP0459867.1 NAD(P)/FAD-dependent oxidoreductase [Streptomyces montanisoli]
MKGPRVAVVGAGMAAARFAERYGAFGGAGTVTLYGAEAHRPYNRVLLADVLAGRFAPRDIALPPGAARVRTGAEVVRLDPAARTLALADGSVHGWDSLVLATGANPVLPPIRGVRLPGGAGLAGGVHVLRTLDDCAALARGVAAARRAVIVGGGVLGVSAARALASLGVAVEIVHQGPHLVERHLDADAAAVLARGLARLGVVSYPGSRARAVRCGKDGEGDGDGDGRGGEDRVSAVELACGPGLSCDLVVLACGARPRTALAYAAGLGVRRGITVDDALATSAPGVYAIGDCAEHDRVLHGLAAPAWEQADVLAARLSGARPAARYRGSRAPARLAAGPLQYAAFGEVDEQADPGLDALRLVDATRDSYRKVLMRGDRLAGAVLVGDMTAVDAIAEAFGRRGDPAADDPHHLLVPG